MADKHGRRRRKSGRNGKRSSKASTRVHNLTADQLQVLGRVVEQPGYEWGSEESAELQEYLQQLKAARWIEKAGDIRWKVAGNRQLLTGSVSLHPDGYGFLNSSQQEDDVYLGRREMTGLMPGDHVLVNQLKDKRRNRFYGEVLGIIRRGREKLVGRVVESGRRLQLQPDDPAISESFKIAGDVDEISPGSMVIARITRYPSDGRRGRVLIERQLDDSQLAGMATEIAMLEHDLPHEFANEVNDEAHGFGETVDASQYKDREDLRDLPLVTIDGEDARDFDDAVFGAASADGWRLVVAIADVSSYVKPGSALDREAYERGTSVYFPTRVVPMLPEALSNGLCSLRPQVQRLALVCDMQLTHTGEVSSSRFYPAVICSHARLTYKLANRLLEREISPADAELSDDILVSLKALQSIWRCRDQLRGQRGALAFERRESMFVWNMDGTVKSIQANQRLVTHRLIEEAMIAANVEAAKFLLEKSIPGVLRVHPPPSGDKLAELERMLLMYNIKPGWRDQPAPEDFAQILTQCKDRADSDIIEEMLLRAQSLAVYKPIKDGGTEGHFALALTAYSHFTSPIRRYPDLLLHRAIYSALDQQSKRAETSPSSQSQTELATWAQHCSFTERRAEQASRDVEFRLKCHYLKAFEGQAFEGWVTGVKNFGLFVELEELQISGLLHVSNLGGDYYIYDERDLCLYNRRNGKRFNIGDKLSVRLIRVDIEQRKIDFSLN